MGGGFFTWIPTTVCTLRLSGSVAGVLFMAEVPPGVFSLWDCIFLRLPMNICLLLLLALVVVGKCYHASSVSCDVRI